MLETVIGSIASPIFEKLWDAGRYTAGEIRNAPKRVEAIQDVLKASQNYVNKYLDRHGQVKVMPGLMKEPLPLDSIYTAVKFLDESCIRYFSTHDELERTYRAKGRRGFQADGERHDGMSVAKDEQYLMVLGQPGVGKSTFLRKLGLEAFKGKEGQLQREQIPVFIELKTFRGSDIDLKAIIAKEFRICGFPVAEDFTDSALEEGKLLVLLDGLDEVPTRNLNPVIEHIEDFVTQHSNNTFIASCRTAAYQSSFRQFADVTIADFDDEQIEQFIRQWFSTELDKEAETADRYWELLSQSENAAAKELAQTPLLLTFLCLVYDREQTLPSNRSDLYSDALNILLKEWAAQKRLESEPIYKGFHPVLEKVLLSEIAYNSFKEDRLFFSKSNITERITTFLADKLDAPEHLDGEAVLTAIEKQQGILVERASNAYSFSHLTLQEYLTALYIVKNQRFDELVSQHLTDKRWREVFLLVAGLMEERVHELLDAIDQTARTYIANQPKLCNLLQWASRATEGSTSEYKGFEKRAAAIASAIAIYIAIYIASASASASAIASASDIYIASDIDRAIASDRASDIYIARDIARGIASDIYNAIARDIASARGRAIARAIARDIASARDIAIARNIVIYNAIDSTSAIDSAIARAIYSAIDGANRLMKLQVLKLPKLNGLPRRLSMLKEKIPQLNDASAEAWRSFADKLKATWLNAFGLTVDSISLSPEEWQLFNNYLYANELLLRCKDSSVSIISRKAWEALEEKLLKL